MKTLIAYCTRYGTAAACAQSLARQIGGQTEVVDLGRGKGPDPRAFDVVIVGGSIYAGRMQRKVVSFCERHREVLLSRRTGVYLCCLYTGEQASLQMRSAFPDWLLAHSFHQALAGGELRLGGLSFVDRLLVRALPERPAGDISRLVPKALEDLAAAARSFAG